MKRILLAALLSGGIGLVSLVADPIPDVFSAREWYKLPQQLVSRSFPLELENTSWNYPTYGVLVFKNGYFGFGDPWSGINSWGRYTCTKDRVVFSPDLQVRRWGDMYRIRELILTTSDRKTERGKQILIDGEDSIQFTGATYKEPADFYVLNGIKCNGVNNPVVVFDNEPLLSLPEEKSKNLISQLPQGRLMSKALLTVTSKAVEPGFDWEYVEIDFTQGDPVDGGGPFYSGWMRRSRLKEITGSTGVVSSDNLRIRAELGQDPLKAKVVGRLQTGASLEILEVSALRQSIDGVWNRWYKIRTKDQIEGWVFGGYVDIKS